MLWNKQIQIMMIRHFATLLLAIAFTLPAQAQFGKAIGRLTEQANEVLGNGGPLTEEQMGEGLKEALNQGVEKAVTQLSTENGYYASPYKILLPEEAQAVVSRVSALPGFGNVEQDLVERLNKAAELAAKKATPIFVDAITGLTIKDALNLVMGDDDAATRYLETNTSTALIGAFQPVIKSS